MIRSIPRRLFRAALPRQFARTAAALGLAAVFVAGCDVHGVSDPGTLSIMSVSPNPKSLAINGTQQFAAVGTDFAGVNVPITPVWSVVSGGGTIDAAGMFTAATTPGTFTNTVMATSGGKSATATVTVTVGPLASLTLTPTPVTLAIGATQQYTVVGKDAGGNVVSVSPTWSVVAGGGSISQSGLFTAGTVAGAFPNTVVVSSGGIFASATVNVLAGPAATVVVTPNPVTLIVGAAQQFTAVAKDANGNVLATAPVWAVVAGGGAINSAGLFTAGSAPGTFPNTVRATVGNASGTATVNVTAGPVATISVSPNPVTLLTTGTQQFNAVGRDVAGNVVSISPVWTVVNGGGSIDTGTGLFTAAGPAGTYTNTIKATSGAISGFATVVETTPIVLPPAVVVTVITVTPNPAVVPTGGTQQFSAVGRDANGNILPMTATWSIVAGGGAIDPNTGLFTAGPTAGTFASTVKATNGLVSGFATVTVTVIPTIATITVAPNPAAMLTNSTMQFAAVARDINGNILPFNPLWTVVAGGGSIDGNTGLFTSGATPGTFTNTVKATNGVVSGFATVIVNSLAPAPFVALGGAAANGIMAGTAVSCTGIGTINANVSVSPGLGPVTGPCIVTGISHFNDALAIQDQLDLKAAYDVLAGLPCGTLVTADLGGTTKTPGVYCSASTMGLTGTLTLNGNGDPNAVFVFQMGSGLTTAGDVVLINGAQAKNVYWQVGSSAVLGTASHIQGNILSFTSITLVTNTTLLGRALARGGAVTVGTGSVITLP